MNLTDEHLDTGFRFLQVYLDLSSKDFSGFMIIFAKNLCPAYMCWDFVSSLKKDTALPTMWKHTNTDNSASSLSFYVTHYCEFQYFYFPIFDKLV